MPLLRHRVTYQGLPCKAVSFSRSEGLQPDSGWVDIDAAQIGELRFQPRQQLVRSILNAPCPITPQAFDEMGASTTTLPEVTAQAGGGLNPFGDLVLQTFEVDQPRAPLRYRDIYATHMQEVAENLKEPGVGAVRVKLTDIRAFYPRRNPCVCLINVKRPSGRWDPRSLNPKDGKPWTFDLILRFLFSQLPGSPGVFQPDTAGLPEPSSIIGRGEPIVEILQRVLEEYRLVALLQPDNNYTVKKVATLFPAGSVPVELGQPAAISAEHELAGSMRDAWYNTRPQLVEVIGEPRVSRITSPMVPVVRNERGRWELLAAFVGRIGYSMAKLHKQVLLRGKAFMDVPPTLNSSEPGGVSGAAQSDLAAQAQAEGGSFQVGFGFGSGGGPGAGPSGGILQPAESAPEPGQFLTGDQSATGNTGNFVGGGGDEGSNPIALQAAAALHAQRRQILRAHAYRSFAPAFLFAPPVVTQEQLAEAGVSTAQATIAGPTELDEDDFRDCNFLPVVGPAFSDAELQKFTLAGLKFPQDAEQHQGDDGPWRVVSPIVWAGFIGESHFINWRDARLHFTRLIATTLASIGVLQAEREKAAVEVEKYADRKEEADRAAGRLATEPFHDKDEEGLQLVGTGTAPKGPYETLRERAAAQAHWRLEVEQKVQNLEHQIARLTAAVAEYRLNLERLEGSTIPGVHANHGLDMIVNVPYQVVSHVGIDPHTGIVTFGSPACLMQEMCVENVDNATVISDGAPVMTWGYEHKTGDITDMTTVLIGAVDEEENPQLAVCGASRPAHGMADIEHCPGMRLYEDELGHPFNMRDVQQLARGKAAGQFAGARAIAGREFRLGCFLEMVLDGGIQAIQHIWDGTKRDTAIARTIVYVNAPGAVGPLGPARRRAIDSAMARAMDLLDTLGA